MKLDSINSGTFLVPIANKVELITLSFKILEGITWVKLNHLQIVVCNECSSFAVFNGSYIKKKKVFIRLRINIHEERNINGCVSK